MSPNRRTSILFPFVVSAVLTAAAVAQTPQFHIVKPSTTGVPGEEVRAMGFDPAGNLWVAARWPFWSEGGVAMLSADQLQHDPLPGGGFDTGAWKVWSNVHHPIPSPYLNVLRFSADGTIWVASDAGLTRFRPNATPPEEMWFTYTPSNSPLLSPQVRSLAIDSQENLWVANGGAGLFRFNPATNQWTHMNPGMRPRSVIVGNNDRIFVSLANGNGIMEYDGNTWTHRDGASQLEGLLQDSQGNVWATTSNFGLWKWNGSSWQHWQNVGGTMTITGLGLDRDGVVYISTWNGGVYKMINDTPVFFVDAGNIPGGVIGRPNGDIWIRNNGGTGSIGAVRHYTAAGQLLERINTYNSGLPDYFVDRIKRDSAGNMWFATAEAGLSRMLGSNGAPDAATRWRNWGNHNYGSEPYPWAGSEPMYTMFEDANGLFWMGGNGIGRWDSNTGQFTGFWNWANSNLSADSVEAIVKRNGVIWIGVGGSGAFWFNGTDWVHAPLSRGGFNYQDNDVNAMAVDTQNNLWVGSEFGLRRFAAGSNTTFTLFHDGNSPLPSGVILDVEADPAGGVWVATDDGLARFNGTWTVYRQANTGWPGPVVTDIARRPSDGLIAVSTFQAFTSPYTGGVSTFNGTSWAHYTPVNSPLTHWQASAVEFDSNGHLWASPMSEGVVQILIGTPAAPLQLVSAVSRKTHGSAGQFDIPLTSSGDAAVECRSSGGAHIFIFTFDDAPVSGSVQFTGTATPSGSPTFSGNTMTVNVTGVPDVQTLTVTLNNVTTATNRTLSSAAFTVRILAGDTTGNRIVNSSDVGQAKAHSGQPITAANFRSDVVPNGEINATDLALIKARAGSTVNGPNERR